MGDMLTNTSGGDAFARHFADGDERQSVTVYEDGTLAFTGGLSGDEAMNMLHAALQMIQDYMRYRMLPASIVPGDIPRGKNFLADLARGEISDDDYTPPDYTSPDTPDNIMPF